MAIRVAIFSKMARSIIALAFVLLAVAFSSVAWPQAHSPYAMRDSGFPAEDFWRTAWIDNDRVLFTGVELGSYRCSFGNPGCGGRGLRNSAFIWIVSQNKVVPYRDRILVDLCMQQGYVSYKAREKPEDARGSIFAGPFGRESKRQLTKGEYWFNPISCRYFTKPPLWAKRRMDGRFIQPLLEQDGFIDYGLRDFSKTTPEEIRRTFPVFWSADGNTSRRLDIEARYRENIPLRFSYAPFAEEYFARASTSISSNVEPAFYLSRTGELRKVDLPKGPWGGWHYFAVRPGIFFIGGVRRSFSQPGNAGGYLFAQGHVTKVVTGNPRQVSVSPDGCKVAFVYTWSQQAQTDGYKAWKQGKVANTLRMIDLCHAEKGR